jgi:15-cis-phytoene synthase
MDINYQISPLQILPQVSLRGGIASPEDYAACRQIMRKASKNYSTASNYLPGDKLPHVEALYALMRVGDDRVDVSHAGFSSPLEAIEDWERTYWEAFEHGNSPNPVMRAYLDTALKFGIPSETMSSYFRAMKEDLSITRFPTFNDLLYYMDGSAIPVGRAMAYILGMRPEYDPKQVLHGADSLSIAMQLSNFWRDIGHDWRIGRVYLPQEDMHIFRYSEEDLAAGWINDNLVSLLEFEFERTERYYDAARQSVKMLASGKWAVMSALEIYQAILSDIRANRYDIFSRRAGAGSIKKLSLALKSYWQIHRIDQ